MIYFVLLSGLLNLACQSMYLRVISAVNGDYYLTFLATTLTFISASALGNRVCRYFRAWLGPVEAVSGLYALLIAGIHYTNPAWWGTLPLTASIALLVPPALTLGTHFPLYTYFSTDTVQKNYGYYHLGAAGGILLLETLILPHVNLATVLALAGGLQVAFGLSVTHAMKHRQPATSSALDTASTARVDIPAKDFIAVFMASMSSYIIICWTLAIVQLWFFPTRMHNGTVNGVVFFMMAVGGFVAVKSTRTRMQAGAMAAVALWLGSVGGLELALRHFGTAAWQLPLPLWLVTVSICFTAPTAISAYIFAQVTTAVRGNADHQVGLLLVLAALGAVAGGVANVALGDVTYSGSPALIAAVGLILAIFLKTGLDSASRYTIIGLLAVVGGMLGLCHGFSPMETALKLREPLLGYVGMDVLGVKGSHAGVVSLTVKSGSLPDWMQKPELQVYVVDGHTSHYLEQQQEIAVSLLAAKYTESAYQKAMVIGLGSGQSAYGMSMIAKETDVVEISPAVIDYMPKLGEKNGNLLARKGIHIIPEDGLKAIRNCQPHSYDVIFNTSTYAMTFNAYKLYSDEFIQAAKRCLKPTGLMMMYMDNNEVGTAADVRTFLAPLAKNFGHIQLASSPYPVIFAADRKLEAPAAVTLSRVVTDASDLAALRANDAVLLSLACSGASYPSWAQPRGTEEVATLNNPVIERLTEARMMSNYTQKGQRNQQQLAALFGTELMARRHVACQQRPIGVPAMWSGSRISVPLFK